jgi:hypothetical protein
LSNYCHHYSRNHWSAPFICAFIPLAFRERFGFFISERFQVLAEKIQFSIIEGSEFLCSGKDYAFQCNSMIMFIFSKAIAVFGRSLDNLFCAVA